MSHLKVMDPKRERGFTLVEILVVVGIIAVLLAASIPIFVGAQNRARDRAAQLAAREALVSAKIVFQIDEDYGSATWDRLTAAEPAITFLPGADASGGPEEASVHPHDSDTFVAAVRSGSGTCFYIRDLAVPVAGGGTSFGRRDAGAAGCTADDTTGVAFDSDAW